MKAFLCVLIGAVLVAGCGNPTTSTSVSVTRTPYNEVQIKVLSAPAGQADYVLMYHLGFEQASDRFVQMEISRRLGRGRLAEILGEKAIASDRRSIGIGLARGVEIKTKYLMEKFPEEYRLLQSFSDGINAYIAQLPKLDPATLELFRKLTGTDKYVPTPWEPADSIAIAQNMAFYLSSALHEKLIMGQIANAISTTDYTSSSLAGALDLRPVFDAYILDAKGRTPALEKQNQSAPIAAADSVQIPTFKYECVDFKYPFPECSRKALFGSNNWVVKASEAGVAAFLANDPHLRLTSPLYFWANGVNSKSAGGTFYGAGYGLVGIPGFLIGHNSEIAVGFTNNPADVDDIYFDILDNSGQSVWVGTGRYEKLDVETVSIPVRDPIGGGITHQPFNFRWSKRHGAVFSEHIPEVQTAIDEYVASAGVKFKTVAAYKWVGHEKSSEFVALLGVNRASNFTEFKHALQEFRSGSQNMVFASRSGDIGYYSPGAFPLRPYVSTTQAPFSPVVPYLRSLLSVVTSSLRGPAEWTGFRSEIPEMLNPLSNLIVTANNYPFAPAEAKGGNPFADYYGYGFSTGARAQRITDLLNQNRGNITLETMKKIQTDEVDLLIKRFVEMAVRHRSELELGASAEALLARIAPWDGEMSADAHEPLLAEEYVSQLMRAYLEKNAPKLSPQTREMVERTSILGRTLFHNLNDVLSSAAPDSREPALKVISVALDRAAAKIEKNRWQDLAWGTLNRLHFYNPIADILSTPAIVSFPIRRGGSLESINVSGEGYGPNFRLILSIDKEGPITGVTSICGGNYKLTQKDEIYSELKLWQDGNYRPFVPIPN